MALSSARSAETRDLQGGGFLLTLQRNMENIVVRAYDAAGVLLWEGAPVDT